MPGAQPGIQGMGIRGSTSDFSQGNRHFCSQGEHPLSRGAEEQPVGLEGPRPHPAARPPCHSRAMLTRLIPDT